MNTPLENQDSPWKEVLHIFFQYFMAFFFPLADREIEWKRKVRFLDKELQQIFYGASSGRKVVDILAEIYLKNGNSAWILVHVEVQSHKEEGFAERMFVYNYRIYERYKRPVAGFAVLADDNPAWKPNRFGYNVLGCEMGISFPIAKIMDYKHRWDDLEKSKNPFATIVMAHLKALETKKDRKGRLHWKLNLIKGLYKKGHTKSNIIALFRFIDGVMTLPQDLENLFWERIQEFEEVKKMPYLCPIEKKFLKEGFEQGIQQGMQQGIQQGILQNARDVIFEIIRLRFKKVPRTVQKWVKSIDELPILKALNQQAITSGSLNEFLLSIEKIKACNGNTDPQ